MKTGRYLKKLGKTALKGTIPAANILIDFSEDDDAETEEAILAVLVRISDQLESINANLIEIRRRTPHGGPR